MMNSFSKMTLVVGTVLLVASCANKNRPNYQYMPNMYESVGYETYSEVGFLPDGKEGMLPVDNTIARGKMPYKFPHTLEGKEMARQEGSPLDSLNLEKDLEKGGELFNIYCAICHGPKGDGQGNLVKREKILGVPNYSDPARNISVGDVYYTIYYGLNSMGSYANQLNEHERWQVATYVMKLKEDLSK